MTQLRDIESDLSQFRLRLLVVAGLVLFAFVLLLMRLVYLQVWRHEDLDQQAETNRTAIVPVVPNRGLIFDRNGVVLATNYSAYTLEITPSQVPQSVDQTIDELSQLVSIDQRDRKRFRKLREESRNFESIIIRSRLSDEEVARFAAQSYRFPGVEIKARLFRNYPLGETASHVVGYIGRINQAEKERLEESPDAANYRGTEHIGKLGVEQAYERALHGTTGVERVETSASGRAVRRLASSPPAPGQSVVLSIDVRLQKMVEDLFGERRGALVALDPQSGEVLAFVSKPTFDPNLFVDGIDVESWQALNESLDRPLLNRALRGTYPPGSTYKPFMALAALELGRRSPSTTINDPGYWMFGNHRFRSHGDEGLGSVDMYRSIVKSSNVYYYSLANELGVDAMHDFMRPLGFGQITGIDIPGEVRGVLPSQEWKRNTYKRPEQQRWYAGETISLGIGQGYNTFTMLQLAQATATLANGGTRHTPRLVLATHDPVSQARIPTEVTPPQPLGYKPEHVALIRDALVGVTQEGTSARVFAGAGYLSAGKTGTAQAVTIGQKDKYDARKLEEHERDHALYMAYAPATNPRIAVAVIVENAGFGAQHAAPIARRVFDYWLLGQYPSEQDIAASQKGEAAAPLGTPRRAADVPLLPGVGELARSTGGAPTLAGAASPAALAASAPGGVATTAVARPWAPVAAARSERQRP